MAEQHQSEKPGSSPSVSTGEGDRRRADRWPLQSPVRVQCRQVEFGGTVRDRSLGGLFLAIDGDLVFDVEFQEDGQTVHRSARLLRSQRLPGGQLGWAVEFLDRT